MKGLYWATLCGVLAGCCTMENVSSAPSWLGIDQRFPPVRMCTEYCSELKAAIDDLRTRLNHAYQHCGSQPSCQQMVIQGGRKSWEVAVVAYETVNSNVPTIDKQMALSALRQASTLFPRD